MRRRNFFKTSLGFAAAGSSAQAQQANRTTGKLKITRVRAYRPPRANPTFNQADLIVTVETDGGITGIGEGGSPQMIEQCAAMLIGEDPMRTDHLWQLMFRGFFYPAGLEKLHALGALDLALWDIKGKSLDVPVYQLLGGLAREHMECYTAALPKDNMKDSAKAAMDAGFRAFRTALAEYNFVATGQPMREHTGRRLDLPVSEKNDGTFPLRAMIHKTVENCKQIRAGVGPDGDWAIDIHTRLDLTDSVRMCNLLEPLEPLFVEDPLRSEALETYRTLRPLVKVPIAAGEQFGSRWQFSRLIEDQLIDYLRATLPNVGGITEWMKIAALCETHMVGLIPHGTGPISTAALVHGCAPFAGPVLLERGGGAGNLPYLPQSFDFKDGKVWPNQRPGLGVEFVPGSLQMVSEVTKASRPIPVYNRPDGSMTNW